MALERDERVALLAAEDFPNAHELVLGEGAVDLLEQEGVELRAGLARALLERLERLLAEFGLLAPRHGDRLPDLRDVLLREAESLDGPAEGVLELGERDARTLAVLVARAAVVDVAALLDAVLPLDDLLLRDLPAARAAQETAVRDLGLPVATRCPLEGALDALEKLARDERLVLALVDVAPEVDLARVVRVLQDPLESRARDPGLLLGEAVPASPGAVLDRVERELPRRGVVEDLHETGAALGVECRHLAGLWPVRVPVRRVKRGAALARLFALALSHLLAKVVRVVLREDPEHVVGKPALRVVGKGLVHKPRAELQLLEERREVAQVPSEAVDLVADHAADVQVLPQELLHLVKDGAPLLLRRVDLDEGIVREAELLARDKFLAETELRLYRVALGLLARGDAAVDDHGSVAVSGQLGSLRLRAHGDPPSWRRFSRSSHRARRSKNALRFAAISLVSSGPIGSP